MQQRDLHHVETEKSSEVVSDPATYSSCRADEYTDTSDNEDEEEISRERAAAFMVGHFHVPKSQHHALEKQSLYGAVILIPQIGRSCRWPRALKFVTVRVYILFLLNFFLQSMLLCEIAREQNVLDLFAGQMWLCDFGAPLEDCPSSPSCTGPGGTQVDGPRLYDFKSWSTRNFVKDSLKRLFPDREGQIEEEIDPGEYGAESRICRWIACFIFMLSIQEELILIYRMACLLYEVPTHSESWIEFKNPGDDLVGDNWLEYVDVSVAGMPLRWKIINGIFILGGKFLLWKLTAEVGITFLMETQTISDCIVNSVALSFVLHMDELILMTLTSGKITSCLEKCGEYSAAETTSVAWQSRIEKPIDNSFFANIQLGVPWELLASLLLCAFFIRQYYSTHCEWTWDGWWYFSKPIFVPTTTAYPLWRAFLPDIFPTPSEKTSSWTMPLIWHPST